MLCFNCCQCKELEAGHSGVTAMENGQVNYSDVDSSSVDQLRAQLQEQVWLV